MFGGVFIGVRRFNALISRLCAFAVARLGVPSLSASLADAFRRCARAVRDALPIGAYSSPMRVCVWAGGVTSPTQE